MRLYCDTQGSWVRVCVAYENQLCNRVKTEGRTKYLKCSTVGCDGSAKIVGDMFFLGICIQSVLFIYLVPRGMTWTFVYKLKLVTPILIERNIARKKWICYLATIAK